MTFHQFRVSAPFPDTLKYISSLQRATYTTGGAIPVSGAIVTLCAKMRRDENLLLRGDRRFFRCRVRRIVRTMIEVVGKHDAALISPADAVRWEKQRMATQATCTIRREISQCSSVWKWATANHKLPVGTDAMIFVTTRP